MGVTHTCKARILDFDKYPAFLSLSQQSVAPDECSLSSQQTDPNQPHKKKQLAFWWPSRVSATSIKEAIGEIHDESHQKDANNEALGLEMEEALASM